MTENHLQKDLASLFARHMRMLKELKQVLSTEQDAIKKRDPKSLNQAVADKTSVLKSLEILGDSLSKVLTENGITPNNQRLEHYLESPELQKTWLAIKSELLECAEKNQVNGRLIELSQSYVSRILEIIRGDIHRSAFYSANGKISASVNQHALAKV